MFPPRSPRIPALLLVAAAFALAAPSARPDGQAVPADFAVVAAAGGMSPDHPIRLVVFDDDGDGEYCRTDPPDRDTGHCSFTDLITLGAGDLDAIWTAIQTNGFFGLDSTYADSTVADGSFAELIVTGNGTTHRVTTYNMGVTAFDAVVLEINSRLPADRRLHYNAIHGQ